jgi:hypothetical protein
MVVRHVFQHESRVALERIAEAAAAGGREAEDVAGPDRHVGKDGASQSSSSPAAVGHGIDGRPPSMPQTIARSRSQVEMTVFPASKHDRCLADADTTSPCRPGGIGEDFKLGRQDRFGALLPSTGCDIKPVPKRGGDVAAVLAVAPAPAAGQPVVEHEDRLFGPAGVEPAGQQIFQVEGASERALRHDLRPDFINGVHDLLERHQEAGNADRPAGIDDRAFRRYDFEHPVETAVEREVGEERLHARRNR